MTDRNILPFPASVATNARSNKLPVCKTSNGDEGAEPIILKMPQQSEAPRVARSWDAVILLHGLFADRSSMSYAQQRMVEAGYFTLNIDYPTRSRSLDQHGEQLLAMIRPLAEDEHVRSINFLTHSFGGLVVRNALTQQVVPKARRAVMLAPPNSGTHLAKYSLGVFDRLFPIVRQLSEAADSLPNQMGTPENLDIGVIAASADRVVRERNTHLAAQKEHCVIPTSHLRLPNCEEAVDKALNFLRYGSFSGEVLPTESTSEVNANRHAVDSTSQRAAA